MKNIFLFLFPIISYGQIDLADTTGAILLYEEATQYYNEAQFDVAQEKYRQAFKIYDGLNLWDKKLQCLVRVSACYTRKGIFEDALSTLQDHETYYKQLGSHPETSNLYNILGVIQNLRGNFEESLVFNEVALKIRKEVFGVSHNSVSSSLNNMATVYSQQGKIQKALGMLLQVESNYIQNKNESGMQMANTLLNIGNIYSDLAYGEKALLYYQRSLDIRAKIFKKGHPEITTVEKSIANVYFLMGAYNLALERDQKVLSDYVKTLGESHYEVGVAYMNMGNTYHAMARDDEAIISHKKGINILLKSVGEDHPEVAQAYNNIGEAYSGKGEYKTAIDYLTRSIKLREKVLGKGYVEIGESQFNIAGIHEELGEIDEAISLYEKSLATYKKTIGNKSPLIAKVYIQLAKLYADQGNYLKGSSYVKESIDANTVKIVESQSSKSSSEHLNLFILLQSQSMSAYLHRQKNSKEGDLEALKVYAYCDSIIGELRKKYITHNDKLKLSEFSKKIYGNAIRLTHKLYSEMETQEYLTKAFYYAERSKSSVLQAALNDTRAKYFTNIPDTLLERESELKINVSYYQGVAFDLLTNEQIDSVALATNQTRLITAKEELRTHISFLEKNFPAYHSLKFSDNNLSIEKVQKALPENTSLIEYVDLDSMLFAFVVSPEKMEYKKMSIEIDFSRDVAKYSEAMKKNNSSIFAKYGFSLFEQLVKPLTIPTNKLIIIPDGKVWSVNFELLVSNDSEGNFKNLPYLIKDFEITYLYNADLLSDNRIKTKQSLSECLAFSYEGDQAGDAISFQTIRSSTLSDLPGTRDEIHAISDFIEGTYYYGELASEKNFKRNVDDYRILHLALHGEIDNEDPMNSKLHFTQSQDSLEDGYLHAFEIYNLDLNAELAVLSACNTGVGRLVQGEGVMSLARAFAYAGCRSLVMSQWEVTDATNPKIMKLFYEQIKEGETKSSALRQAKLSYLKESPNSQSSPYLWGSMIHIGDNSPTFPKRRLYWIFGVLGVVALLSIYSWRSSKK